MNIKEIKELIVTFSHYGINELEIERAGVRVKIRKDAHLTAAHTHSPATSHPVTPTVTPAFPIDTGSSPPAGPVETVDEDLIIVRAPIVGTFYRAPSPEADVYVKIGDSVEPGRVLCIIEAMKLMNEIEAEVSGEIVKVYVENAESVEFGQALFGIRPTRKS
ncbi:MAG: acetyl-CoA carboxylase biotin carboxyl carrier protein [Terriglobia bacterium]